MLAAQHPVAAWLPQADAEGLPVRASDSASVPRDQDSNSLAPIFSQGVGSRASHCGGLASRDGQSQRNHGRPPMDVSSFGQSRGVKTKFRPVSPSSRQKPCGVKFTAGSTLDDEDTDDNGSCQDMGSESDDSGNDNCDRVFRPHRPAARNLFRQDLKPRSCSDNPKNPSRAPGRKGRSSSAATSLSLPALQPATSSCPSRTSLGGSRMSFGGVACGTLASAGPSGVTLAFLDALHSTSRPGATLRELFTSLIMPATRTARCAYVSLLGGEYRARPTHVLVCSWEETVADVVTLVVDYAASLASQHHQHQQPGATGTQLGRLNQGYETPSGEQTDLGTEETNGSTATTMANSGGGRSASFAVWLDLLAVNFHAPAGPAIGARFSTSGTPAQSYSLEAAARERARALPSAVAATRAVLLLPGAQGAGLREHPVTLAMWHTLRGRGCSGGATLTAASAPETDIELVKAAIESLKVSAQASVEDALGSSEGGSGGPNGYPGSSDATASEATAPAGGQSRMSPDRLAMRALREGAAGSAAAAAMAAIFAADPLPSRTVREGLMAAAISVGMALLARPVGAGAGTASGVPNSSATPKAQSSSSLLPLPQQQTQSHNNPPPNLPVQPAPGINPSGQPHPPSQTLLPSPSGRRAALPSPVRPTLGGDPPAEGSGASSFFKRPMVLLSEAWSLTSASPASPSASAAAISATGIDRVVRDASARSLSFTHLPSVRPAAAAPREVMGDSSGGSAGLVAASAASATGGGGMADWRYGGGGSEGAGLHGTGHVETGALRDDGGGEVEGPSEGVLQSSESFSVLRRLLSLAPLLVAPVPENSGGSGSGSTGTGGTGSVRLQRLRSIAPAPWEAASPLPSPVAHGALRSTSSTAVGGFVASPIRLIGAVSGGSEARVLEEAAGLSHHEVASPSPTSRKQLAVLTSSPSQHLPSAEGSAPPVAPTMAATAFPATDATTTAAASPLQQVLPPPPRRGSQPSTSGTGFLTEVPSSVLVAPSSAGMGLMSTVSFPLPRLSSVSEAHPGPWGAIRGPATATAAAAGTGTQAPGLHSGEALSPLRGSISRQQPFTVRPRRVMTLSSLKGAETDDSGCDTYGVYDASDIESELPVAASAPPLRVLAAASLSAASSTVPRPMHASVASPSSPSVAMAAAAATQPPSPFPPLASDLARLVASARLLAALGQPLLSLRLARHALTSARSMYGARHLDTARCAIALASLAIHFQQQEQEQQTDLTQQQKRQKKRPEDETGVAGGGSPRQPKGQGQGLKGWRPRDPPRRLNGISNNWPDANSSTPAAAAAISSDISDSSEPAQKDNASIDGEVNNDDTSDDGRDPYSNLLTRLPAGTGTPGNGASTAPTDDPLPQRSPGMGPRVAADTLKPSALSTTSTAPLETATTPELLPTRSRWRSNNASFTMPAMSLSFASCSVPYSSTLQRTPSLSTLAPSSPPSPSGATGDSGDAWSAVCFTGEPEVLLRGAAVVLKEHLGPGHEEVLAARRTLAALMTMEGRHEEALQQLVRLTGDTPIPSAVATSAGGAGGGGGGGARPGPAPLRRTSALLSSEVALSCRLDFAAAQVAVGQQREARKSLQVLLALIPREDADTVGGYTAAGPRGGQPVPGGSGVRSLSELKCAQLEARAAHQLARLEMEVGETSAAQVMYRRAIESYSVVYGSHHLTTAGVMLDLASLNHSIHEYVEAKELYDAVLEIYLEQYGAHHPATSRVSSRLIEVEEAMEQLQDA